MKCLYLSLSLGLGLAVLGCGADEPQRSACGLFCETFYAQYDACVESMSDDARASEIRDCTDEIEAQRLESGTPVDLQEAGCATQESQIRAMSCGEFGEAYSY